MARSSLFLVLCVFHGAGASEKDAHTCDAEAGGCPATGEILLQKTALPIQNSVIQPRRSSWGGSDDDDDDHDDDHDDNQGDNQGGKGGKGGSDNQGDNRDDDHGDEGDDQDEYGTKPPSPPRPSPTTSPTKPPRPSPTTSPSLPPRPSPSTSPSPSPNTTWKYAPMKWIPDLVSEFQIKPCTDMSLPASVLQILSSEKKTKCMSVFGVLIAGTDGADSNAMRYSANIIAQLLDQDCDGKVDDPSIADKLDKFTNPSAGWINYGTDAASEESADDAGSFSSQVWKADTDSQKPQIALEEAFHMVHQTAWSKVYSKTFGYKEWGHDEQSVACRCMREAQCKWYQHPENGGCTDINGGKCFNLEIKDVFKSGTTPGTCASGGCSVPSCDCLEFFHKVETTWIGNQFSGYDRMERKLEEHKKDGLTQREVVEKLLRQSEQCSLLLEHMKDPKISLPKQHITETYHCLAK